jgi:NADPH:quinone reductase-like Zn-dependent oxidoreductase
VKSLGAEAAFDYNDPECAAKIKAHTKGNLKYVWDTIALEPTAKLCAEVISPGGRYGAILNVKLPRDDVKETSSMAYTATGEPTEKPFFKSHDNRADFEFMKKWMKAVDGILAEGKLKVHPPKVGKGLEEIPAGLDLMRNDKVSGQKLVYAL